MLCVCSLSIFSKKYWIVYEYKISIIYPFLNRGCCMARIVFDNTHLLLIVEFRTVSIPFFIIAYSEMSIIPLTIKLYTGG